MQIIDHFIEALRSAANYNSDVQEQPHCILWTDHARQWEVVISRLQQDMPELFVLGDYAPDMRQGPAIWLRCVLAGVLDDISLPSGTVPVFYLPGTSRQDLRAVDNCPEHLKPLAELQYRGVIWSQVNAKDWTVLAFLQSHQGGLGLDVAQDKDTRNALQLVLPELLEVDVERFHGKRLDRDDFYQLISKDPPGELLKWLDDPEAYRREKSAEEWQAFVELCRYHFAFNPEAEGVISGAEKLAIHQGAWAALWERYQEAATRYKNIPDRIRACNPPTHTMDWHDPSSSIHAGWPQWNDHQEERLRDDLAAIADKPISVAQKMVMELERSHGHRRETVWAELGFAPLAQALAHLNTLAEVTSAVLLDGGTIDDLATGYQSSGWLADDAVMGALASVRRAEDQAVINGVLRSIYEPWAMNAARYLQRLVSDYGYPGGNIRTVPRQNYRDGTCILFVDGLRFDVARRLAESLQQHNATVVEDVCWSALPSVTATGKPAVSPVREQMIGRDASTDFEPVVTESDKPANYYHFTKLLQESGWQLLKGLDTGDPDGRAWVEIGTIDTAGHDGDLPHKLTAIIKDIRDHILRLFDAGWQQVEIVTDHGWLFLPDGLPKVTLPQAFTENQWGRCAALKSGVTAEDRAFAWFWNPDHYFTLADGISCFRKGISFTHGGLSLQECLNLQLTVSNSGINSEQGNISIAEVDWRGLRCMVTVNGNTEDMLADIRREPGNANSSVAFNTKKLKSDGTASLVVEDEDLTGTSVTVVILTEDEQIITQKTTTIGGENA